MITLSRLNGPRFLLNPDLIERVEATPDTVITLLNGAKYVVAEDLDTVVDLVVGYHARILLRADDTATHGYAKADDRRPQLTVLQVVSSGDDD